MRPCVAARMGGGGKEGQRSDRAGEDVGGGGGSPPTVGRFMKIRVRQRHFLTHY